MTPIGGVGSAYVPATRLGEEQFELHTSLIGTGHAYLASSVLERRTRYGYPKLDANFGVGFEVLPALEKPASITASYYYYPELSGTYSPPNAPSLKLRYKLQTFTLGAQLVVPRTPFFLEIGFYGHHYLGKQNAPGNATHRAALLGFGFHV